MELTERVDRLEDEVKVIKNEVQTVLLDIRESYLNRENPFNPEVSSPTLHSVAATISGPSTLNSSPGKIPRNIEDSLDSAEMEEQAEVPVKTKPPVAATKEPKVATAGEHEASEEVNEALRSEEEPEVTDMKPGKNGNSNGNGYKNGNGKIDLVTISGLARWVNGAVSILGPVRTETVLDFAELTGHLPPELKNILVKLANRIPGNDNGHSPAAHQLILSLIELEGLLGMNNKSDEITLLAMVCQEVDQSIK